MMGVGPDCLEEMVDRSSLGGGVPEGGRARWESFMLGREVGIVCHDMEMGVLEDGIVLRRPIDIFHSLITKRCRMSVAYVLREGKTREWKFCKSRVPF